MPLRSLAKLYKALQVLLYICEEDRASTVSCCMSLHGAACSSKPLCDSIFLHFRSTLPPSSARPPGCSREMGLSTWKSRAGNTSRAPTDRGAQMIVRLSGRCSTLRAYDCLHGAKWGSERILPIPPRVANELDVLAQSARYADPEDLVFAGEACGEPIKKEDLEAPLFSVGSHRDH